MNNATFQPITETLTEGCLSVPGKHGEVERYSRIKVKYFNGKEVVTEEFTDMNARIIQHEYDHIQGVLYIDKAINIADNVEELEEIAV